MLLHGLKTSVPCISVFDLLTPFLLQIGYTACV